MKRLFTIAVVLTIISTAAFCQNGYIDGAGVGPVKEVVEHFLNKGYTIQKSEKNSNSPLIFMLGKLKSRNVDVLIYMKKEERDTTQIEYICMYFPKSNNVHKDYFNHKKCFINGFGRPTRSTRTKSYWMGEDVKYTIGVEDGHVYHSLEKTKL
jgi:hypothetical protein